MKFKIFFQFKFYINVDEIKRKNRSYNFLKKINVKDSKLGEGKQASILSCLETDSISFVITWFS